MCELCIFIVLRWRVDPPVVPRCPGIFSRYRGSASGNGILRFIGGRHFHVDVVALPRRVIAVRFRVRVWFYGVETPTPLLHHPLSERGDGMSPRS